MLVTRACTALLASNLQTDSVAAVVESVISAFFFTECSMMKQMICANVVTASVASARPFSASISTDASLSFACCSCSSPTHNADTKCASCSVAFILSWQPGGIDISFADHSSAMVVAWSASEHLCPSLSSSGETAYPFHQGFSPSMCVLRQLMTCSALLWGSIVISALFCICAWHSNTCQ